MAVTSAQIVDFLLANPGMSDADIVSAMGTYGISPAQMASAVGLKEGEVAARVGAAIPPNQAVLLGDTYVQAVNQVTGSGENEQVGGLENVITYKASDNKVGGNINYYSPTGEYQQTTQQQAVAGSFLGGLVEAITDPVVLAAIAGGYGAGLFGGAGALGSAATVGATGLTAAEIAGLTAGDLAIGGGALAGTAPLTAAQIAGLTATDLAIGAGTPTVTSAVAPTVVGMGTGTGITAAGAGGLGGATTVAGLGTGVGTGLTATGAGLGAAGTGAGITAGTGLAGTGVLAGSTLGTGLLGTATGSLTGTGVLTGSPVGTTLLGTGTGTGVTGAVTTGVGTPTLGTGALTTGVGTGVIPSVVPAVVPPVVPTVVPPAGLTAAQIAALIAGGFTTAGGLLQQQTSKEAATKAQAMIDAQTEAAKASAQFRPIGMTTRFGSSQFGFDPKTGQLTSAGYTLSPEAKNAQDRFVKLAESGLQQAEGAQAQFAPLQTGAQSLFGLGNKYLAQSPEDVASNYMKSQLALLAPGREQQYAFLQNQLQQQGRGGLSVAQGTGLAPTSPELAAFMNAKIQEDARLAANAQQYGQQNVLFGAGLLGQGATAMGNYYGGQQQAYSPYTTAMGQVTGLESAAQQPFQMGVDLGKIKATTGFDVGRLGLQGAGQSVALATGPAATNNPYASLLTGAASSPALTEAAAKALVGLFS